MKTLHNSTEQRDSSYWKEIPSHSNGSLIPSKSIPVFIASALNGRVYRTVEGQFLVNIDNITIAAFPDSSAAISYMLTNVYRK